jgi:hypothetical protein
MLLFTEQAHSSLFDDSQLQLFLFSKFSFNFLIVHYGTVIHKVLCFMKRIHSLEISTYDNPLNESQFLFPI